VVKVKGAWDRRRVAEVVADVSGGSKALGTGDVAEVVADVSGGS
jgi:hypothetical protein